MRIICPKILNPKPHSLSPSPGFTLIELLIVMGIITILAMLGMAGYKNFNQNQILNQAASTLKTNLRDAQNRALSGEKDCSANVCGGATAGCGNDSSGEKTLDGWSVDFSSNSYTVYGSCSLGGSSVTTFGSKTISAGDVDITPPSTDPILFRPLTHGTNILNPPGSTTITLGYPPGSGKTRAITVTTGGRIE